MQEKKDQKMINYFGYGSNRDLDMMAHIIGRDNIEGEPGELLGYEMCIQLTHQFRKEIPKNSPLKKSPFEIISDVWGPNFEMYVSRPNQNGVIYGTIWKITPEEMDFVSEWELVDYGAQENTWGIALNSKGEEIKVITQTFLKPTEIDRVVTGDDYEPYIEDKKAMLRRADETREQYLELKKKGLI